MCSTIPIYFIKPTIKAISHFKNSSILWKNFEPLLISKCSKKKLVHYLYTEKGMSDMTTWTNLVSPFIKSSIKRYCMIASTYFCSNVTPFLSFSIFFFAVVSYFLSDFYCWIFSGFLLKYLVFIILWINNCYTVSCCMNTYRGDRVVHICNINRSWCDYSAGIFGIIYVRQFFI